MIHPRHILKAGLPGRAAEIIGHLPTGRMFDFRGNHQIQLGGCWTLSDPVWFARRSPIPSHPCVRRIAFEMFRGNFTIDFDPNDQPTLLHGRSYLEEVQDVIRHRMHLIATIYIQSVGPGDGSHYNEKTADASHILHFTRQVRNWLQSISPGWWGIPWGYQCGNEFEKPELFQWYATLWQEWVQLFPAETHLITGGMGGGGLNAFMAQNVLAPWSAFLAVHDNQVPTAELPAHYVAVTRWNQPVINTEDDRMLDFKARAEAARAAGLYLKTALDYYGFPRWWTGAEWIDTSRWGIMGTGRVVVPAHANAFSGAAQSILGYSGPLDLPVGEIGPEPIPPPIPPVPIPPPYTIDSALYDTGQARELTIKALQYAREQLAKDKKPRRWEDVVDTLVDARGSLADARGLLRDLRPKKGGDAE